MDLESKANFEAQWKWNKSVDERLSALEELIPQDGERLQDPGVGPTEADQVEEVRLAMLSIYGVYRDCSFDEETRRIAGKAYYAAETLFERLWMSVEATT